MAMSEPVLAALIQTELMNAGFLQISPDMMKFALALATAVINHLKDDAIIGTAIAGQYPHSHSGVIE